MHYTVVLKLGTRIYVFGSIVSFQDLDSVEATSLSYTVDGQGITQKDISTNEPSNQHVPEFDSGPLSDGRHELSMSYTFDDPEGSNANFYLDYIIYDATENATISDFSQIFIDDNSPYLQWSSTGWSASHTPTLSEMSPSSGTFNESVAEATASGATVSLLFWGELMI